MLSRSLPERLSVLVVEDDLLQRMNLLEELRDAGFFALEAADSKAALAVFSEVSWVDVLITDIRLPGDLDGLELAARLVDEQRCGAVIYATGYRYDPPRMVSPSLIFRKPYAAPSLIAAVKDMVELARMNIGSGTASAASHAPLR